MCNNPWKSSPWTKLHQLPLTLCNHLPQPLGGFASPWMPMMPWRLRLCQPSWQDKNRPLVPKHHLSSSVPEKTWQNPRTWMHRVKTATQLLYCSQPYHCDSSKQHLPHVTKCCASHESEKCLAQSATPATRKRRADIDTLLRHCACHAKRNKSTLFARKSMDHRPDHILSRFVSAAQLWALSDLIADGCERSSNSARTQLQPPNVNENPSLRIRIKGKVLMRTIANYLSDQFGPFSTMILLPLLCQTCCTHWWTRKTGTSNSDIIYSWVKANEKKQKLHFW